MGEMASTPLPVPTSPPLSYFLALPLFFLMMKYTHVVCALTSPFASLCLFNPYTFLLFFFCPFPFNLSLSFFSIQITQSLSWFQSIPVLSVKEELDFVLSTTRRELSFKTWVKIPVMSFLIWQNDFESGWLSLSEEPLASCHLDTHSSEATSASSWRPYHCVAGLGANKSVTVKEPHISLDPAHTSGL